MKKLLTLTLASALSLALIGCGDSDSKKTDPKDVVLNYDKNSTSADYDLKDYLFNSKGKILNYSRTIYTNEEGKKDYKNLDANQTFYSITTEINASTVNEYKNTVLDTENIIYDKKIKTVEDHISTDLARYVSLGDYFLKRTGSQTESGISFDSTIICKIDKHIDSLTINNIAFNDLLKATCSGSVISQKGQFLRGKPLEYKQSTTIVEYFAKGYGEVKSIMESCDTSKYDDKSSSECEQDTTEITTIN